MSERDTSGASGQNVPKSPAPPDRPSGRLRFEDEAPAEMPEDSFLPDIEFDDLPPALGQNVPKSGKFRQQSKESRPSDRLRHEDGDPLPDGGGKAPKADKKAVRDAKNLNKSQSRMDKSGDKLSKAREKLAAQKPVKKPGPVKDAGRSARAEAWVFVHGKIYQVEDENVGTKAAHRSELAGEGVIRGVSRYAKHRIRTRPARRVRKMEKQNIKAKADFQYRAMVQEHPELKKNALSRHFQKRRIKKQYQKQAREAAKKAAKKTAEKGVTYTEKAVKAVWGFIKKNPKLALILALCFLLILIIQSCMGMMTTVGNSMGGAVGASTYPSEDAEILAAEAAYAGMEANLQYEVNNYSRLHPYYEEYHYDLDEVWHDPYVLISTLSAWHDGAWTADEVQGTLSMLFGMQYTLTETVVVEVRSYTDSWTDDEGNSYSETVYYNYYICYVSLENFNLSHLPIYFMGEERLSRYALYMATLGNRPDLFPVYLYPHASAYKDYGRHDIPQAYLDVDPVFAAMMAEAEKYLGFPYIWGGYCPATSFDCSGFVSWVLNHSGWNIGRLGAQGLYNISTRVTASGARPGDLIFFTGTYDTPGVSHVGIYVGDGMMIHAGDPIGYASINTAYWQNHFFAFGRP